ncbi:MAG: C40 family peptidase [Eubacterium sp.]|nr:C40 family peptidase [Eubacterium sp.]
MPGQEFKARGRAVKKMTRKGLVEENLREGTVKDISSKDPEKNGIKETDFSSTKDRSNHDPPESPQARNKRYRNIRDIKLNTERFTGEPSENEVPFSFGLKGNEQDPDKTDPVKKNRSARRFSDRKTEKETSREDGFSNRLHEQETAGDKDLSDFQETVSKKRKRKQLYEVREQRGRLSFSGMEQISGGKEGIRQAVRTAQVLSDNLQDNPENREDNNAAADALYAGHDAAEKAAGKLREAQRRSNRTSGRLMRKGYRQTGDMAVGSRLHFSRAEEGAKADAALQAGHKADAEAKRVKKASRFWQRKRYKEAYRAAGKGSQAAGGGVISGGGVVMESLTEKGKRAAREIFARNQAVFVSLGVMALLFIIVSVSLFSCSSSLQGAGSLIRITTYQSTDQDIYAAENAYRALERDLDRQINEMQERHPGHDDYRYQIDEIGHNPYHLISYLSAKYGVWAYDDVKDELKTLFQQQYTLETRHEPVGSTTTKTVRVGESLGNVVTSGYCNCSLCCGEWAGGATASGVMPTADHTIAVDKNNPTVPMGTKVVMNGVEYTVEDTGSFDRYGVDFDVYYDDHDTAQAHGHKTWEAFIADDNGDREVEVRVTTRQDTFSVTLTNSGFDAVAKANLSSKELMIYEALNITLGNRDYLFDLSNEYAGGGGQDYQIPPEALSDEQAARMIREAQKYLGTPYEWGGSSPSGFDCSGFVSYVINHCGNGWNVGRCSANELKNKCAYVSPAQARPGDLIFFQGTYNTSGASHVGIYIGNGMMIHCGKPVQYASINRDYWKRHFLSFGRIR